MPTVITGERRHRGGTAGSRPVPGLGPGAEGGGTRPRRCRWELRQPLARLPPGTVRALNRSRGAPVRAGTLRAPAGHWVGWCLSPGCPTAQAEPREPPSPVPRLRPSPCPAASRRPVAFLLQQCHEFFILDELQSLLMTLHEKTEGPKVEQKEMIKGPY